MIAARLFATLTRSILLFSLVEEFVQGSMTVDRSFRTNFLLVVVVTWASKGCAYTWTGESIYFDGLLLRTSDGVI